MIGNITENTDIKTVSQFLKKKLADISKIILIKSKDNELTYNYN